jgi:integral membrane sensor domain MASE1
MFDLSLFISIILVLLLWVVMRLNRKIDMIGQLSTVMLTHLAVTSIVIPDEEVEKARDWESWDKS